MCGKQELNGADAVAEQPTYQVELRDLYDTDERKDVRVVASDEHEARRIAGRDNPGYFAARVWVR